MAVMADGALRTLVLAHRDFGSIKELPADWRTNPPDYFSLCLDCIVGEKTIFKILIVSEA